MKIIAAIIEAIVFFTKRREKQRQILAKINQNHTKAINLAIHGKPNRSPQGIEEALIILQQTVNDAETYGNKKVHQNVFDSCNLVSELLQIFSLDPKKFAESAERQSKIIQILQTKIRTLSIFNKDGWI